MASPVAAVSSLLALVICTRVIARGEILDSRETCKQNFASCSPRGASTQDEPPVGSALSSFFIDIVNTVDRSTLERRLWEEDGPILQSRASRGSLCCAEGTRCLLLQTSHLPFCYDNYTTNYFLPGGSYGQIVSGNFNSPDGSSANLISGNYTIANGNSGNVYGPLSSLSKPDLATLTIPSQYTASGTGSAIPVTALGQEVTRTTTIPGTTIAPTVIPETIIVPIVSGNSTLSSTLDTGASTTIEGSTIAPQTSIFTATIAEASSTKRSSAEAKGAEAHSLTILILFDLLLFYSQG